MTVRLAVHSRALNVLCMLGLLRVVWAGQAARSRARGFHYQVVDCAEMGVEGVRAEGFMLRIQGSGSRVQGLGLEVYGWSGFRVHGGSGVKV